MGDFWVRRSPFQRILFVCADGWRNRLVFWLKRCTLTRAVADERGLCGKYIFKRSRSLAKEKLECTTRISLWTISVAPLNKLASSLGIPSTSCFATENTGESSPFRTHQPSHACGKHVLRCRPKPRDEPAAPRRHACTWGCTRPETTLPNYSRFSTMVELLPAYPAAWALWTCVTCVF